MKKKENGVAPLRQKNSLYLNFFKLIAKMVVKTKRIEYVEKPAEGEVAIFAANHAAAMGPISMGISFDRPYRPWVIRYVAEFKVCKKFAYYEFLNAEGKRFQSIYKMLSYMGACFLTPLIKGYSAIRVYHGHRVMNTFKHSIQTLDEGKNIVIFPENNEYFSDYVHELNKGFVDIGRLYYQERGIALNFYPVYIAPTLDIIKVGKPIKYNPEVNYKQQRLSITKYLRDEIYALGKSLPEHKPWRFTGEAWEFTHAKYMDDVKQYLDIFESIESK